MCSWRGARCWRAWGVVTVVVAAVALVPSGPAVAHVVAGVSAAFVMTAWWRVQWWLWCMCLLWVLYGYSVCVACRGGKRSGLLRWLEVVWLLWWRWWVVVQWLVYVVVVWCVWFMWRCRGCVWCCLVAPLSQLLLRPSHAPRQAPELHID